MSQTTVFYNPREGNDRRLRIPQQYAEQNVITINDRIRWCQGLESNKLPYGFANINNVPYSRYRASHNRSRNLGTIFSPEEMTDYNKFTQLSVDNLVTQERGNLFFNHPVVSLRVDGKKNIKTFSNDVLPAQLGVQNQRNGMPQLEPIKGVTVINPLNVNSEYYNRYGNMVDISN